MVQIAFHLVLVADVLPVPVPDASGTLQSYQYQGLADPVVQADGNGIALRQTLDSFGELSAQNWVNVSTNASVDDHVYAYDADGNVIAKDNLVTPAGGQTFGYDNLNRITSFAQGVISDGAIASPASSQGWTYDALGNQLAVTSNGTPVSQTFNSQNQLTSTGSTTLGYDNAGNTTTDQNGDSLQYDAWGRLVSVASPSGMQESFTYNALGQRITQTVGTGSARRRRSASSTPIGRWSRMTFTPARPRPARCRISTRTCGAPAGSMIWSPATTVRGTGSTRWKTRTAT